jgi:hypothetical protein
MPDTGFMQTLIGIVGLFALIAIVSVLVSRNANTAGVIQATASGIGNNIGVATAPVTGNKYNINLSYPSSGSFGSMGQVGGFIN